MTGTGTKTDPYVVTTWNELMNVLPQENTYAILNNDIDMKGKNITNSGVILACNLDGQNHSIKNVYLNSEQLENTELFKMYYSISFKNVKLLNWYVNGVSIFSGDSSSPANRLMPTIESFTFSGILTNNECHFLTFTGVTSKPIFKNSSIFTISDNVEGIISISHGSEKPIFENSKVECYGNVNKRAIAATLDNSHITGELTISSIDSNVDVFNVDSEHIVSQNLIDIHVQSLEDYNASFNGDKLLVNTTLLGDVITSGTFIACTLLEEIDETFLNNHGFLLGDKPTEFSWNDWLASISSTAYYDASSNEHFLTYNTNDGKYNISIVDLPNGCYTRNMPVWDWQSGEYYFAASDYKKYRCVVDAELPEGVYPLVRFFRNGDGDEWLLSGVGDDVVIQAPYSTSSFTVNIGAYNRTGHSITENVTFNNVTIYEHSSWKIENDKLVNSDLPDTIPIGAFCNCVNLENVSIPESIKHIGPYTFYNTKLKKIKIASNCVYYDTSFPRDCEIVFYE
jgi:hypothetical protein